MDERLSQTLHEIAERAVPDDLDLWPAIRTRIARQDGRPTLLRSALLDIWPPQGRSLFVSIGLAALVLALGLFMLPNTQRDVVEFLGLDGGSVQETASATFPVSAVTDTPSATPTPGATVQTETTLTLAFEDTPLPTLTRSN